MSIITDPNDPRIIYISTSGGGAWRTTDAGTTWAPLFDNLSNVQTYTISGSNPATDTYSLTYTDPFTQDQISTIALPFNATAAEITAALDAIVGAGNSVTVNQVITNNGVDAQQTLTLDTTSAPTWISSAVNPVNFTQFTLGFNGAVTAAIAFTGNVVQDAADIQEALNTPGFFPAGSSATVSVVPGNASGS